ncbi:hypothetical protein [Nocardia terpenica]|uniref:hypothetical protein n=1 Tax=Nocardia terpenica TaxID=455432 RepID=UPI0002FDB61E|nr:hypothetical protein [Nocardia terpenica]NQE85489.1 hypothetical protein [Nocardia terpenica]
MIIATTRPRRRARIAAQLLVASVATAATIVFTYLLLQQTGSSSAVPVPTPRPPVTAPR